MKNRMLLSVLNVLLVSLLFSPNVFSQTTVVSVVPASVPSPRVGQLFTVDIDIRNGRNVAGYQVMLHFNFPSIEYVRMEPGDYLPANAFFGDEHFIGGHGTMLFAATASPHERNGNGTLARLTFKINEVEASTFRLSAGDPSRPRRGTLLSNKNVQLSVPRLENAEMFRGVGAYDLVVESPRPSDTTVAPGDEFTLTVTVANRGGGITPPIHLFYYRSTDPYISRRADIQVGGGRSLSSLGANRTDTVSRTITAPAASGTYYYGACVGSTVEEADPDNNCSDAVKITVAPPRLKPGLVVQSVSPSKPTVSPGESFTLSATVANRGTAESDPTTLDFYRSKDPDITIIDTRIGTVTVGGLGTPLGGRSTSTKSITVPAPSTPGTYYYGACVNRGDGQTYCSDAVTVTVQRGTSQPDLVIESVRAEPATVAPGEDFKLYATLKNQGTGRSSATTLRYYRSDNAIISTSDTQIGKGDRDPLPKGDTIRKYLNVPAPTEPGIYYYGACVDEVANESNTGNNCYVDAVSVTVEGPTVTLPPDFISNVAYSADSTYFVLTTEFLTPNIANQTDVVYRDCTIALDLPGVPDEPVSVGLTTRANPRFDNPGYFMLPLLTPREKVQIATGETVIKEGLGLIPGVDIVIGIAKVTGELSAASAATADPIIVLPSVATKRGRPDGKNRFVFLLTQRVTHIKVSVEQEYVLLPPNKAVAGNGPISTATYEGTWDLEKTWRREMGIAAAPSARPMTLADYPPFQQLPLEVQAYLLQHFGDGGTAEAWQIPEQSALFVNYPNPFNPETWIPYQLAEPADVTLTIYDIHGRVVRDLNLGHQRAGTYQSKSRAAYWDGRNAQSEPVASGLYFYTLEAGDFTATRKLLIRK